MVVDPAIDAMRVFATETIRQMGRESLKFYGKSRQHTRFDQNLVTQTELHLTEAFLSAVRLKFPHHHVFGQDQLGEGYTHEEKRYLWVFDPLDGVDNFQSGIPIWGMSLALYENYWPVMGCFHMPATNDLFRAFAGEQAFWNDQPIHTVEREGINQESLLLTNARFHQSFHCRFPGKIRSFGSAGAHACYVAMGRADAALTAKDSFRDLAAVRVIIEAAGGNLTKTDGSQFFLNDYIDGRRIEDFVLIGSRSNAHMVSSCLEPL